jgi:transposase InsO family protein
MKHLIQQRDYMTNPHSDQGSINISSYKALCVPKCPHFYDRKGSPIDDSPIESWNGILKKDI